MNKYLISLFIVMALTACGKWESTKNEEPGDIEAAPPVAAPITGTVTVTEHYWTVGVNDYHKNYGFDDSQGGWIDPQALGSATYKAIFYLEHIAAPGKYPPSYKSFIVYLYGHLPQNYFTKVTPENGVALLSADATFYHYTDGYTYWLWEDVDIPPRWDGAGASTVTFND